MVSSSPPLSPPPQVCHKSTLTTEQREWIASGPGLAEFVSDHAPTIPDHLRRKKGQRLATERKVKLNSYTIGILNIQFTCSYRSKSYEIVVNSPSPPPPPPSLPR